ncbi:hypothetical protein BST61_g9729 [Cercospora zeina]
MDIANAYIQRVMKCCIPMKSANLCCRPKLWCRPASHRISVLPLAKPHSSHATGPEGTQQHSPFKRLSGLNINVRQTARPALSSQIQKSPEELHERLAKTLRSPASTLTDVKAQFQVLRPWLIGLDPQSRPTEASKYLAGARTLSWLWSKNLHAQKEVLEDFSFFNDLALFLVAEKRDRFMSDWIFVELPEESEMAAETTETTWLPTLWRAALWRSLVGAELTFATSSTTLCLDAAITRLLQIQDRRVSFPRRSWIGRMSPHPAISIIVAHVGTKDCSSTNPLLYDQLITFTDRAEHNKPNPQLRSSVPKLHLSHPARPNAEPFLRLLRLLRLDQTPEDGLPAEYAEPEARIMMRSLLERAEFVLQRHGPKEELEWLRQTKQAYEKASAQTLVIRSRRGSA